MPNQLTLRLGQYSDKGRKPANQDFFGGVIPHADQLGSKGAAFAIADGISSSQVSQVASETAVKSFLSDYYCTSDAWSINASIQRVLQATNAWLYAQTQQGAGCYDKDRGYVCTFSALVLRGQHAHLCHVGDSRIYRMREQNGQLQLEQLTHDHRVWSSENHSCLARALGIEALLQIDQQSLQLREGDLFILATDGIYEHCDSEQMLAIINAQLHHLDSAAKALAEHAYAQGSEDNLTVQLIRVDKLPASSPSTPVYSDAEQLPYPPELREGSQLDGYQIKRVIHSSHRSHVYLGEDQISRTPVIIKVPSIDGGCDPEYIERFLLEEWIARRVNSIHVVAAARTHRPRNYLYTTFEYIQGQTLAQWQVDNPRPSVRQVREIISQLAKGLYALHRNEILHQDIRPQNILIEDSGTVKIIDFGSAKLAGVSDRLGPPSADPILGDLLYTAPEYFIGEAATERADIFAVGVLTYHLLSGRFPYGTAVARARSVAAQRKLSYQSVLDESREIPAWLDEALRKAVHPLPERRYQQLSEFIHDLHTPNMNLVARAKRPLLERNPVALWQGICAVLVMVIWFLLQRGP